jgi:hypothetical protein
MAKHIKPQDIREHMEVIGSDGQHVGTVDHMDGADKIKLTKADSKDGQHHFIPLSLVDHVDAHVHLNRSAKEVLHAAQVGSEAI